MNNKKTKKRKKKNLREKYPNIFLHLKEAVKDAQLEAMYEFREYERKRKRRKDTDLISKSQAYKLRSEKIVDNYIALGLLTVTTTGERRNSTQYVSKSKLLSLDEYKY